MGYTWQEMYEIFKKYSKKVKYIDCKNITKFFHTLISRRKIFVDGLNSGEIIEKTVNMVCNKKNIYNIKDIKKKLIIPSVDLYNGEVYIFSSTRNRSRYSDNIIYINDAPIGQVVRASCSYPGVFSPCKYKNTELIDGGIRENIPWKELRLNGASEVICIVFQEEMKQKKDKNIVDVITSSISILSHELANYELYGADNLIKIKTKNISLLDVKRIDELFELGYIQTKKELKKLFK